MMKDIDNLAFPVYVQFLIYICMGGNGDMTVLFCLHFMTHIVVIIGFSHVFSHRLTHVFLNMFLVLFSVVISKHRRERE
jgi:hypothetical protein